MIDAGMRASQPSMKFFSQARSAKSCTARSSEVLVTCTGARRIHPVVAARGPAMHHRVGHVRVKLEAEGVAGLKRLHREVVALGQQFGASGSSNPSRCQW